MRGKSRRVANILLQAVLRNVRRENSKETAARQRALRSGSTVNHIHRKFAPATAYGARLRAALYPHIPPRPVPAEPRSAERSSAHLVTLLAIACVPALLWLERWAPAEMAFHALYLVPVAWLAARWGRASGWGAALIIALAGSAIELRYGTFELPLRAWNAWVLWATLSAFAELSWRLAQARQAARQLARTDSLTQVNNSRAFREAVEHEIARSRRYGDGFAVAYIDVDHFKHLNDRWGHETGDAVLRHVGTSLRSNLRRIDTVARMGGDEFAVLLPQTNAEQARTALDKWRRRLTEGAAHEKAPVTVSVGIAAFERPPESVAEVIRTADAVMYGVKHAGRDGIATSSDVGASPPTTSGAQQSAAPNGSSAPADSGTTRRWAFPRAPSLPEQPAAAAASERPQLRPLKQRGPRKAPARKWLLTGKQV